MRLIVRTSHLVPTRANYRRLVMKIRLAPTVYDAMNPPPNRDIEVLIFVERDFLVTALPLKISAAASSQAQTCMCAKRVQYRRAISSCLANKDDGKIPSRE